MRNTHYIIVAVFTFAVTVIHFNWGLPNNRRLELVGGLDTVAKNIPGILEAKQKANADLDLSYEEQIHYAVRGFLLSPWAADDGFTLSGIKKLNPYELRFDPQYYMYGGGLIYMGAAFIQTAAWLGYVKLNSDPTYYMKRPGELGRIYTVLRFMVMLYATLGICLVYHIARVTFDRRIAFIAWTIVVTMPVTHQAVRSSEPHIFVLPLFIIAFYFTVRTVSLNIRRDYILAAIFAGFSIGTQATSFYIVFAFIAALAINYRRRVLDIRDSLKYLFMYGFLSTCSMLLINPFYVLNYQGFLRDLGRGTGNQLFNEMPVFHYWTPLQITWFLILLFLSTVGFHLAKNRNDHYSVITLSTVIPAILIYFSTGHIMPYIYCALPLLAILAAVMLRDLYQIMPSNGRMSFVVITVLLFIAFPLARSAYYIANYTSEKRESAGEWINQNFPAEATIALRWPPTIWDCVPFNLYKYRLVDYRSIIPTNRASFADGIVLLNAPLPEQLRHQYKLVKAYRPSTVFGFRFELGGELHALIGKTVEIYSLVKPGNITGG